MEEREVKRALNSRMGLNMANMEKGGISEEPVEKDVLSGILRSAFTRRNARGASSGSWIVAVMINKFA